MAFWEKAKLKGQIGGCQRQEGLATGVMAGLGGDARTLLYLVCGGEYPTG